MKHVVLLRGINVGGINIKMADLRSALASAGFRDVRTILATGNVLLDSSMRGPALKKSVETTLSTAFGYEAWVIVVDEPTLRSVIGNYPFGAMRDGWHRYVVFGNNADHLSELSSLADILDPDRERIAPRDGVVYWEVTKGSTTDSVIGKFTAKAKYKPTTTTRNLRTLIRMLP